MKYLLSFLAIALFLGTIFGGTSYAKGGKVTPTPTPTAIPVPPKDCQQVITPAIDPETGVCDEFATPCDVPVGWQIVPACL